MQTLVVAEYDLTQAQVMGALAFYEARRQEIEAGIGRDSCLNHREQTGLDPP